MQRQSPCGVLTDTSLVDEMLREFTEHMDEWKETEKTLENIEKLRRLHKLISGKFRTVVRYGQNIPPETLSEIEDELIEITKVLQAII